MGIVLGELAHPGEAVQHPGTLVAQHRAQLEEAQGQVPVAPDLGFVNQHVGQAVHRFDAVHLPFHFGEIHLVPVVVPVAGAFPQVGLEHLGAHDHLVAPLEVLPALEILDEAPEQGALGMVDHHPRPRFLFDAEQPQLPAQAAVVPAFGFLQEFQVVRQFLRGGKGGAVDALEHGPVFVPPPVGPGGGGELEGLNIPGGRDVGPPAEIDETSLLIEAHLFLGDLLQEFHLVGFALAPEIVDRLLPATSSRRKGRSWAVNSAIWASIFARSSGVKGSGTSKS